MSKTIGVALLALGVFLMALAFVAGQSVESELSIYFTGVPSGAAMITFLGGVISVAAGGVLNLPAAR